MSTLPPKVDAFLDLLQKWNKAYNLTAVRDREQMVSRHAWDSLSIRPYVQGKSLLDVGSGAGLPGLILAIVDPALAVTVLDSNGKKVRFCEHAIDALGLTNAKAVQERVEAYRPGATFDTVVSRAFATVAEFVEQAGHLCAEGGVMLAMKGAHPAAELAELPGDWQVVAVHRVTVPGLDAERHIVVLGRTLN